MYKRKYIKTKENSTKSAAEYMDQARSNMSGFQNQSSDDESELHMTFDSVRSRSSKASGPGSVASLGSGLAQQARSIASSFSCAAMSDRVLDTSSPYRRSKSAPRSPRAVGLQRNPSSSTAATNSSRSSSKRRIKKTSSRQEMEV